MVCIANAFLGNVALLIQVHTGLEEPSSGFFPGFQSYPPSLSPVHPLLPSQVSLQVLSLVSVLSQLGPWQVPFLLIFLWL